MIPLFDAHCDTAFRAFETGSCLLNNELHTDLTRAGAYTPYAQVYAVWGTPGMTGELSLHEYCLRQLDYLKRQLEQSGEIITLCRDLALINSDGKAAAILSVEGAELLDCDEDKLKLACDEGVRIINPAWNLDNEICGSSMGKEKYGLTEKGRGFIQRALFLGMVIDLSHASERAFWDIYSLGIPLFASHSNAAGAWPHPRSLSDEQFRAVVSSGGVAGINLFSDFLGEDPGIEDIVRHIEHFLSLGGEKSVGLGADLDGCEKLPRGFEGIQDMGKLYNELLRLNYKEDAVRDIFYNNTMRVMSDYALYKHKEQKS